MRVSLTLSEEQFLHLEQHLFCGDGYESVAIILCGRRDGQDQHRLVSREVHIIENAQCRVRREDTVTWSTDLIEPILDRAEKLGLSVVKVHSHPNGFPTFSKTDDISDAQLLPALVGSIEGDFIHGSAVMLPNGRMFGRYFDAAAKVLKPLDLIEVAGDDIYLWNSNDVGLLPEFAASHGQAFGDGTYSRLSQLSVAVVGASGTGSIVVEQLARLGVGRLTIVDDDVVEDRNLNRILNSTAQDARLKTYKVDVLKRAIDALEIGTTVRAIPKSLWDPASVQAVAECDVVFGCVDTIDGRFLINLIASYYSMPYFDVGVRLIAVPSGPKKGEILEVCGSVHYVKPGGSSLISRGLFSLADVSAAGLARRDRDAFERELKEGYIKGVIVKRPAVISLNMTLAALAVNELLARIHPFRERANGEFRRIELSLSSMEMFYEPEDGVCTIFGPDVGKGDRSTLLDLPELSSVG